MCVHVHDCVPFSQVTKAMLKSTQACIQIICLMLNDELIIIDSFIYICSAQSKLDIIFSVERISNFNATKSL